MKSQKEGTNSIFTLHHIEEKMWVRKVREIGDRNAFESIFRTYYKRLHGYAYSFVKQPETAEDIVQSVFLKIWARRKSWDPPGSVKHYLFLAVKNEALNKLRHQKVIDNAEEEVVRNYMQIHHEEETVESVSDAAIREKIQHGIDKLPSRCRQIFLLNRRSGLTYTEIADYLGISINTVNTQMGRALKSLRIYLSKYLSIIATIAVFKFFL